MSTLMEGIAELRKLAVKAGTDVEQFAKTIEVAVERQAEIDAGNRSSQEERTAMDTYLQGLDGAITPDMPASDICLKAGVRKNRGTVQYAAQAKKRLLLTFKKSD